jgi:hypothetical protein
MKEDIGSACTGIGDWIFLDGDVEEMRRGGKGFEIVWRRSWGGWT